MHSEENHPLQSDNHLKDNSIHREDIRNMDSGYTDRDIDNRDNQFGGSEILHLKDLLTNF